MANIQESFISLLSTITNLGSDRYVKEFKRTPLHLETGRTELSTDREKESYSTLEQCARLVEKAIEKYPILNQLNEIIFISLRDVDDLHLTAIVKNGKVETSIGWQIDKRPTLIIPMFKINLEHLQEMLTDGETTKEELYRIARVLFVSFMRGLYDAEYLYTPGDKRYLKLDKILHVELLGMDGVEVDDFPGNAQATVANVDGEWLVFEGFQGTPRVKVTCNLDQALQYYQILMIEMRQAHDMASLKTAFDRYTKLREETVKDLM